jgi:hypothetical protein
MRPSLSAFAPVKLPFTWPNSSLSISSEGIAPQLTGTKGMAARAPESWIRRATSSLPVPESPTMCTGAWLRATLAIMARTRSMAGELPSSLPAPSAPPASGRGAQLERGGHQLAAGP